MADHAEFDTVIDVEDHTGNILPEEDRAQPTEAQKEGFDTAKKNAAREAKVNTSKPNVSLTAADKNLKDARESAEVNARALEDAQPEQYELAKNDTTKAGKIRATKAQLDPAGDDPISNAEIERAATDGEHVRGGTSVSNEEQARRAATNGRDAEESDHSIAGDGPAEGSTEATEDAAHANGNENEHTGEGGIAKELAGPQNQSGKTATTQEDSPADNS